MLPAHPHLKGGPAWTHANCKLTLIIQLEGDYSAGPSAWFAEHERDAL